MTTFNDREKAAEAKYAHDEENTFKIAVRRNKLLGLWVAEQLGKSGASAEDYAKEVIQSDFDQPGDDDVFAKVWADLQAAGSTLSEHQVRRQMDDLKILARQQITSE
jgi:hypothetical protein